MDAMSNAGEVFQDIQQKMEFNEEHVEKLQPMFDLLAKDIAHQRKRLGESFTRLNQNLEARVLKKQFWTKISGVRVLK